MRKKRYLGCYDHEDATPALHDQTCRRKKAANKRSRQHGRVVRALDLKSSGGRRFKSSSEHLAGVCLGQDLSLTQSCL